MVSWTQDKEIMLLIEYINFLKISSTNPPGLLQHLANVIGDDCTPKAVSYRLASLRSRAKGTGSGAVTPSKKTATKDPKTPVSTGKRGRPATKAKNMSTPTKANGRQHDFQDEDEDDSEIFDMLVKEDTKCIKTERNGDSNNERTQGGPPGYGHGFKDNHYGYESEEDGANEDYGLTNDFI